MSAIKRADKDRHGFIAQDDVFKLVKQFRLVVDSGLLGALLRSLDARGDGTSAFFELQTFLEKAEPTSDFSHPSKSVCLLASNTNFLNADALTKD
eukprot:m.87717 g.87717  ORF g.87717 m.87717 type:complete len:95 (-) comp21419_c0_seq1:193-477(-)